MNLLCGSLATVYAVHGEFYIVWILCILASVFDFFDGFAARKLGAYSPLGKELDSLSDLVSFGLAPSVALMQTYRTISGAPQVLSYVSLAVVACSALRLAKFNLDERQTKSFLGLPTPACGLLLVSLAAVHPKVFTTVWFIPLISAILAYLLVCERPMFSMKQKSSKQLFFFIGAALLVIVTVILFKNWNSWWIVLPGCMANIFYWYIIINLIPNKKS